MRPGRHQRTLPPRSPRRGECGGARLGTVWARMAELPGRGTRSPARFLELGDAARQAPANPPPALPTAWGVRGSPRGGSLGQFGRVAKTGHALADPFLGDGRCGPAGTSEPSPRAPHDAGSAGGPVWGPFGPGWPSCQNGSRARRPVFWNWEMRPGRHPRVLPARSPRRGECGGARLGPVWARMAELPKRVPRSPTRFLELGDAARQSPANPPPALPTAWGLRGGPAGGPVWSGVAELSERGTRSPTRFLELGDAGR